MCHRLRTHDDIYNIIPIYFWRGSAEEDVPEGRRWWAQGWFFRNEWRTKKKINIRIPSQINDRVIGFSRADKRDFVKAGANTMNIYIYISYVR